MLPIRTTVDDVVAICSYLSTKPTGASMSEAKAVVDPKVLDGRKVSAFKVWGMMEDTEERLRITPRGRDIVKNGGAKRAEALGAAVSSIAAYLAIVERAVHRSEPSLTAVDVASHWYDHFRSTTSENENTLNDQAVCFFNLAEGADLGRLVVGRKGMPTRFEFDLENCRHLASEKLDDSENAAEPELKASPAVTPETPAGSIETKEQNPIGGSKAEEQSTKNARVFITHGKNKKILDQVKEIVEYGKFVPVIAQDNETAAKPVPDKVMDDMRSCGAALIHVGSEGTLKDEDGNAITQINGNVLIEIGAAMALYRRKFILLVEEGVKLPSNLQGLYECRYSGDELNMTATMKILKAFNEFN